MNNWTELNWTISINLFGVQLILIHLCASITCTLHFHRSFWVTPIQWPMTKSPWKRHATYLSSLRHENLSIKSLHGYLSLQSPLWCVNKHIKGDLLRALDNGGRWRCPRYCRGNNCLFYRPWSAVCREKVPLCHAIFTFIADGLEAVLDGASVQIKAHS